MTKALFLDRDGVINVDKNYVYKREDFEFCESIFALCEFFAKKGFKIVVITNQSGIARGFYSEADFEKITEFMRAEFAKKGIKIDRVYHCPHLQNCQCRKPKPGMLLKARDELGINLEQSFFIGDNFTDMSAGINAGVKGLFLVGKHALNLLEKKEFNEDFEKGKFRTFSNLNELLKAVENEKFK